ncbi:MAG: S41 family peptidase, partial [Bacteroidales bacterium]|nr:S41 family peptidase [Bacteroidales bacterium]
MKIELLMINSVLFLLLCSINSRAQQKVISNIEMKEDIEELFVKLNSIHVNLYDAFSEDSAILLKTNLINKLPSQLSQKEFTKKLIPLVARFNDGHTRIDIPKYEKAKQKELLPIKVHISEDNNIFVVGNYNLINDGDQIVEIDGISATHLVDTLKKYVSAEHEYFRLAKLSDRFSVYANYIFDINTKSVIRTKQGFNGILMNIKLNQIQNQTKIFDFQVYDTIAYLKLSIFMYPRQFFSIVDSSFEILKAKKIDKLIIDIRENSGGNTMLSSYLFNYLDLK